MPLYNPEITPISIKITIKKDLLVKCSITFPITKPINIFDNTIKAKYKTKLK